MKKVLTETNRGGWKYKWVFDKTEIYCLIALVLITDVLLLKEIMEVLNVF